MNILLGIALLFALNGCAKDAEADVDSEPLRITESSNDTGNKVDEDVWSARVIKWWPTVKRITHKKFISEVICWEYYELETNGSTVGESLFGIQVRDHQGNRPDKEYMKKNRPPHREYPTRIYHGLNEEKQVWLTCDY